MKTKRYPQDSVCMFMGLIRYSVLSYNKPLLLLRLISTNDLLTFLSFYQVQSIAFAHMVAGLCGLHLARTAKRSTALRYRS